MSEAERQNTTSQPAGGTTPQHQCSCSQSDKEKDPQHQCSCGTCSDSASQHRGRCACGRHRTKCGLCPCMWGLLIAAVLVTIWTVFFRTPTQTTPTPDTPPASAPAPSEAIHSEQHGDFQGDATVRPVTGDPTDPLVMRQKGEFAQALEVLRQRQKENPSEEQALEILDIIEDTGRADDVVANAREFQKQYPESLGIEWSLAKGLLFAAATHRPDPKYASQIEPWLDEAEQCIKKLEGQSWVPPEVPGYLAVLKTELAFMRGDWKTAETFAKEGLRLGTTAGETGDLYALLFDVACRQGDKKTAASYINQAMQVVAKASANSYYGLRMFREEALIVEAFILDKSFGHADLDRLWKIHTDLQAAGFVDPTSPDDTEATGLHQALHQYVDKYEAQDYAGCLEIIQGFRDNKPNHTPRCFFSEAVMSPLRPWYLNMAAGKLCRAMGDKEKAQAYFSAAAAAHPQDKLVQEEMSR